ncbi:MAG: MOSC N-terminal beta barrel domain-containing protein [Desulfurococcales archaeon]|nr:MOSC N-terminal beta barrel domain-containing protein [Desulfurococcales archaeon]
MEGAFLYKILVYPVKSLPPVEVLEASVTGYGTLEWDRFYAIVDRHGVIVNGKRERKIHLVRARFDLREGLIILSRPGDKRDDVYHLDEERDRVGEWLTRFLGYEVKLVKDQRGLPDDTRNNGPTVVSTSTLAEVSSWFRGWDLAQARLRFRPNLEVMGVEAFWEDKLYYGGGRGARFRIGPVTLEGRGISKRCVVPSRDPCTGVATPGFQKELSRRRKPMLMGKYPEDDHGYRLILNTVVVDGYGSILRVGDRVDVLG